MDKNRRADAFSRLVSLLIERGWIVASPKQFDEFLIADDRRIKVQLDDFDATRLFRAVAPGREADTRLDNALDGAKVFFGSPEASCSEVAWLVGIVKPLEGGAALGGSRAAAVMSDVLLYLKTKRLSGGEPFHSASTICLPDHVVRGEKLRYEIDRNCGLFFVWGSVPENKSTIYGLEVKHMIFVAFCIMRDCAVG